MAEFLRADITYQVESAIRASIRVTVETRDSAAGLVGTAIGGLIELLLRKRSEQQAEPFDLLRVENAIEQVVEVCDGDELSFGDVTEVRARRQINGGRKFGKKVVRDVEVEIEAGQVALLLLQNFFNFEFREDHSTFGVVGMRKRKESLREQIFIADLLRRHSG